MKRNDITALHSKSISELNTQLEGLLLDLAKARLEKKAAKLADVSLVKRLSNDIARVKTIIHEKELMERSKALLASLKETAETAKEAKEDTKKEKSKKTKKETK